MTQRLSPQTRDRPAGPESYAYFLPRRRTGWWALALLLLTSLYPAYYGRLADLVGSIGALAALSTVVAVVAFGVGAAALFHARDRSILLGMVFAVAVFLVLLGLMLALLLFFMGL